MKVNFASFFKTPVEKYKFFFIYGNDLIVFDRIIFFLTKKFSSSLEIKSEKELLAESSSQASLFEVKKNESISLVYNITDNIINKLDQLDDRIFIFTSEKARAQSKLVTHFANAPLSVAIAAYASPLITAEFEFLTGDLNIPIAFKGLLFKAYQNDYMGLLGALEKIKLYGHVPESAYSSFLETQSSEDELKLLIHSFLLKNIKKTAEFLLNMHSSEIIPVLRNILRSFQALYELMPYKQKPDVIPWQKQPFPIFFKDQPIYQSALSRWSAEEAQRCLASLLKLEYKVKYGKTTPCQINQELLDIL